MIDTTVKNISLTMQLDSLEDLPEYDVPANYGWRMYAPGDEIVWAQMKISSEEFESVEQGLKSFRYYFPQEEELPRRMIFLTDGGVPFATAAAWFGDGGHTPDEGRLHWVSVDKPHQGQGLCKVIVSLAMQRMRALGHEKAYLTTQTSSWAAIKVYHRFGFRPAIGSDEETEGWKIVSQKTGIDFLKDK